MNNQKSKVKSQKQEARSKKQEKLASYLLPLTSCLLFVIASPVHAADEGGHDGGGMIWRIINFAILAAAVFFIVRYFKVKDFFANRRESIKAELEEAKRAKEEADRKVKEFEQKLILLDQKIEEIYKEIRIEGEIEKKKII